jgi:hypothetical protein
MKAATESSILAAVRQYLVLRGIFHWRANQGAIPCEGGYRRFNGMRGVSDLLGVLPGGRLLAIEVKRPGERPTPEQRAFLDTVTQLGGMAILVCSVEQLQASLDQLLPGGQGATPALKATSRPCKAENAADAKPGPLTEVRDVS